MRSKSYSEQWRSRRWSLRYQETLYVPKVLLVSTNLTFTQRFAEVVAEDPDLREDEPMPMSCLSAFKCLWADQGCQDAIKRGNEYALHDNLT